MVLASDTSVGQWFHISMPRMTRERAKIPFTRRMTILLRWDTPFYLLVKQCFK